MLYMKYDDEYKEFICKEFLRVFSGDKIPKDIRYEVRSVDAVSTLGICQYVEPGYNVAFTIFPVKSLEERLKEENIKLKKELDEIKDTMKKLIK